MTRRYYARCLLAWKSLQICTSVSTSLQCSITSLRALPGAISLKHKKVSLTMLGQHLWLRIQRKTHKLGWLVKVSPYTGICEVD